MCDPFTPQQLCIFICHFIFYLCLYPLQAFALVKEKGLGNEGIGHGVKDNDAWEII